MKRLKVILGFFKSLDSKLSDLVYVTAPSNYKTLLDISTKLYDDEVSRYRFLEEKSSRILTLISFLLPSTFTILYWIYSNNSKLFNPYVNLSISLTLVTIIASLFFVLKTYSISGKPVLEISEENIDEAGRENYDSIYLNFLKAYRKAYYKYRLVNDKKVNSLNLAYWFLIAYFACSGIVTIFILISLMINN